MSGMLLLLAALNKFPFLSFMVAVDPESVDGGVSPMYNFVHFIDCSARAYQKIWELSQSM